MPIKRVFGDDRDLTPAVPLTSANNNVTNTTINYDIRPGVGETWELIAARSSVTTFTSPDIGKRCRVRVLIGDGTTFAEWDSNRITQPTSLTTAVQASLDLQAGSLLINNSSFVRLSGDSDSTGGTQSVDFVAIYRVV